MSRMKITGWKFFNDSITDKGTGEMKAYNTGRVFVELPMDPKSGRQKGTMTAEIRVPDSGHINAIKHLDLPFLADFDYQEQAVLKDGKVEVQRVCVGFKPVEPAVVPLRKPAEVQRA